MLLRNIGKLIARNMAAGSGPPDSGDQAALFGNRFHEIDLSS
jgi:hypothetical protein